MTDNSSAGETRRLLQARAAALAQPLPQTDAIDHQIQLIEFTLGSESCAVELVYTAEVRPLANLTPLPGAPSHIAGIIAVRGRIVSVVDTKVLLGMAPAPLTGTEKVLILHHDTMEFGLLVDAVTGVRALPLAQMHAPLPAARGSSAYYLRGITTASLIVLDAGRMLSDESLIVNEEATA